MMFNKEARGIGKIINSDAMCSLIGFQITQKLPHGVTVAVLEYSSGVLKYIALK